MGSHTPRNLYFEGVHRLMEKEDVFIVSADLAGPPFDSIRRDFPDHYVQVGIAEQNLISVACGIAMTGKKVVAYAANPFISLRAFDQIKNGLENMHVPLTIAGLGTGFSIWEYGSTHYTTEDFQIMSLCANMRIITATDNRVAEKCVELTEKNQDLIYIRFDRDCNDVLPSAEDVDLEKGFRVVSRGSKAAILSNGYITQALSRSLPDDYGLSLVDVFQYPYNESAIISFLQDYQCVIVAEELQKRGGLGSTILEMYNDHNLLKKIVRRGVDYRSANMALYQHRDEWLREFGLDATSILRIIEET